MKSRFFYLLVVLLSCMTLHAQKSVEEKNVEAFIENAMNFNRVAPQEKVYLHLDNTGYFENETIWFKAYVTRTDNCKLSDMSKVLYVELLNTRGDVLQTKKYPIENGMTYGEMRLDTILGSGFYEIRAYTRFMTNWGMNAAFSRVIPIYSKPVAEGDYSDLTIRQIDYKHRIPNLRVAEDSVLYGKVLDNGLFTTNIETTVSVQFYPEGGDMVAGRKSRVAMLAVDDNGRPYQGEGFVTSKAGDVLAKVTTDSLGRGLFELVADADQMQFQMKNLTNTVNGIQFFPLPMAKKEGCVLTLDAVNDDMKAVLQCSDSVCGSLLAYVVMHNGNIVVSDTMKAQPQIDISLDRKKLPEGVDQLTVFDGYGRIMAERLFFLCPKPDISDSIRVTAVTEKLKPCGEVELEIQTKPNANLSFSVVDQATMNNSREGDMKTWMLLSSEVRGYIHHPEYYFEADDKEHRTSADLLMMTQGWRRHVWLVMEGRYKFRHLQPLEDHFFLVGQLKKYRSWNPVDNVRMTAILYNESGQTMSGALRTDSLGNYSFDMPFVDGDWAMTLYTQKQTKKKKDKLKTYYVGVDRDFSPKPRFLTAMETVAQKPNDANLYVKKPNEDVNEEDLFVPITKSNNEDHVLNNVTVKAKKRYFTNDDFMYKNESYGKRYAFAYYNGQSELNKALDRGEEVPIVSEFVEAKLKAEWDPYGAWVDEHGGRGFAYIYNNGARAPEDDTMEGVKSIYLVLDERAEAQLGANRATIYVYVYNNFIYTPKTKGVRRTYYKGFDGVETFKTEDYNVIPPMADFRRTIYWNPEVTTDAEGKAKVKFFNNSTCQEMYVTVEGMTNEGDVLVND